MIKSQKHKLTDDEFVEKIRKQLNSSRKVGIFLSVLYVAAFVVFCILVQRLIEAFRDLSQHSESFNTGLAGGFVVGLMLQ